MSHRNQTTRTPKGKAKACQVITFDQAFQRILDEEIDPAFVAEMEARRDSPEGKLDTLEFTLGVTCCQVAELLVYSPGTRAKAGILLRAFKDVLARVEDGTCSASPTELKAEFNKRLATPLHVPTVEIPKALDLIRCLDEADFVNEATEDELEAGIHHQRFEAHKARMMALVNGIGNHLCDAGNDTGEAMLGALSATYRDQEDRRVDACV